MNDLSKFEGFSYRNGELCCEGIKLSEISRKVGTPTFVYSKKALTGRVNRLQIKNCKTYFSAKACSNINILKLVKNLGCGVDVVSGGELFRATHSEVRPDDIIFSGTGKTGEEILGALKSKIRFFNVESLSELTALEQIAKTQGAKPRALLRFNPNIDAKTHPHISTGLKKSKFGLSPDELKGIYSIVKKLSNVSIVGFSCHIGSQILSTSPFKLAWSELLSIAKKAPFKVTHLDLGGGLGIPYGKEKTLSLEQYGSLIEKTFKSHPYSLSIQPGRSLIGPTGILLTKLVHKKKRGKKFFYILDSAMNDLLRPALYGAAHPVLKVKPAKAKTVVADLVGPICESADTFRKSLKLEELENNALLAFGNAGAYGMSMSSQYNSRPRGAEVLVDGAKFQVIRRRESYEQLIEQELL